MGLSSADVKAALKSEEAQEDTYSGEAVFLYSSKIDGNVDVVSVCELLSASEMFSFALDDHGRIYFRESGRLRTKLLGIETTLSEMGMTISGHSDFIRANPGDSNVYSLSRSLNLLLSGKKLFNTAFGFPAESARIFMRPIAIRAEGGDDYEMLVPYVRVYAGGIISIALSSVFGFESSTAREVVETEVNKSRRNISSVLCEKEFHLACTECQVSQMPIQERLAQKKTFETTVESALNSPEELTFLDESLTVYELLSTDQFTLTDLARNLLSVVTRAVTCGAVRARINWLGRQYRNESIGEYWHGKPILFIGKHTGQKESSAENWAAHKRLVNSVMSRTYLADIARYEALAHVDLRSYDDFSNFYSEAVSLMLSTAQVESFIEQNNSYTFNNLTSDVQVLNEASHYIQIYYSYASLGIDKCKTAIDVARLELKILKFEESLISAHKYGEIARYIDEVKRGEHLNTICKLLHKKIETVRKALELDEKVLSESYTRRITIIFGIIASATLSPELVQPLAKYYGFNFADEQVNKLIGIGVSVVAVIVFLTSIHYALRSFKWIAQKFRV